MKKRIKIRGIIVILLLLMGFMLVTSGLLWIHYTGKVSNNSELITIDIKGSGTQIGNILEDNNLIKSANFFKLYLKINNINNLKAGTYQLSENMKLAKIIEILQEGNNYNANEISITFREGINMREIAKVIANNTNNTYDDVMKLVKDKDYLKELINEYWFITDEILNNKIYYSLEGYLFPDTYRFSSKDVSVKDIFNKLISQMATELAGHREEIEKTGFSVHELLTLASIAELEVNNKTSKEDRAKVIGVFINRLEKKMSLGSDITTRYSIKLDDTRPLTKKEYQTINAYNTRSSSMAGKLPAGPIGMISRDSLKACFNPDDNDYLFFISNIKTNETFFYKYSSDFERKKNELAHINQGY